MAKALPRNGELADQLDLLADLSEILDEEAFKVIAYRRAATRIRESPLPVAELALEGKAKDLPGIGRTIENKIVEVVSVGEMEALTRRRQRVPAGVVDFLRLPGVGPKTAARFWTQLGITSLPGLKVAAKEGRLRELPGMGARSEEKILRALEAGVGDQAEPRRLLGAALPAVRRVLAELEAHPASIAVPVGLFGEQRNVIAGRTSAICASVRSRSIVKSSRRWPWTTSVPHTWAMWECSA